MLRKLGSLTLYVKDVEEALHFYLDCLGMEKRSDTTLPNGSRWLTVGVPGQDVDLVLHDPKQWHEPHQAEKLEADIGRTPMLVFETDDFSHTYETLHAKGVHFLTEATERQYGKEAVFQDLYGNRFLLLQPTPPAFAPIGD
ncbi:hypothetical protein J31TS4_08320 [Paenibacillus sp. J31TS4]|uniref:VOC family protein n=1 Tax=Paenibacillus sp. J31TS4 TaxID=2807195 RepID=UPI001B1367FA|nr:VOC family protein [Paenibacillus sp. J31TS4]GIP37552.1 hypothetical protein J31TS4_08320 [Paenibacillus sp. J31TS4]